MRPRCGLLQWALVTALLGASLLLTKPADAQSTLPTQPILRIEAGTHTDRINRFDTDPGGRFLVTGSDDKTARVWDLHTGRLLKVLRPPQGEGNEGKLYAVAISPDGETVATGGWTGRAWDSGFSIYLFDRATGRLRSRIARLPNVPLHLAYSADGRYLAAALGRRNGVRVFRASDGVEVFRDGDYQDSSLWVEFDRQGRLVTTSADGELRLYSATFQRLARRAAPGGSKPHSARFSPDGALIAVGFRDSTAVNVLSSADLRFLYAPDMKAIERGAAGTLAWVEWSFDSQQLYAGGIYYGGSLFRSAKYPVIAWSQSGRGSARPLDLSLERPVRHLRTLSDGSLVFSDGTTAAWGVLNADGRYGIIRQVAVADHGRTGDLRVSHDGRIVEFRFDRGRYAPATQGKNSPPRGGWARLNFAGLEELLGGSGVDTESSYYLPGPRTSGLNVTLWENAPTPRLSGRPLLLGREELSRSLYVTSDRKRFLLGASHSLYLFDQNGQQMWHIPTGGDVWGVHATGDGRFAVAALDDGTIRWYAMQNGRERLASFIHPDGRRVTWTPEGFFDPGLNGEELIGYHLNQGSDREAQFVRIDQLADTLYRPDLIKRRFEGTPEAEAVIAEAVKRMGDVRQGLAVGLPPRLELLSSSEQTQRDGDVLVRFNVQNQGGGIGKIVSRVDGVELEGRPEGIGIPGRDPVRRRFRVGPGDHTLSVVVFNAKGSVASPALETKVHVPQNSVRPTLHVLALGVTNYRDRFLQLHYASDDARSFATQLRQRAGSLFERVNVVTPLVDQDVTLANIEHAFADLATQIKPDDVFVFFAAGHGTTRDGEYLFIPWDLVYENEDGLRKNSLTQAKLKELLAKIVANKSLIVLDTCSAGTFSSRGDALENKVAVNRLMKTTGRAVLAATADSQMALEGFEGHGVFTSSLLRGLAGAADTNKDGTVDINELATFVATDVPAITRKRWGYEQFPMQDLRGASFPIARTR